MPLPYTKGKVPWLRKPPPHMARINWNHPINRDLKHMILWNEATPRDLVTNSFGTLGGTGTPVLTTSEGEQCFDFGTGGPTEVSFADDINLDCSQPCTIIFDIDIDSITSTYDGILELGVGSGSANNSNIFISNNASYRPLTWRRLDSAGVLDGEDQISDGGSTFSGRKFIVCRYDGATADFYVDGAFYSREASGTTAAQSGNTIFGRYGTTNELDGRYHFWAAYQRALSDAEIRAIDQSRFIGLHGLEIPLFIPAGAPAGFQPAWAANATQIQTLQGMS